MARPIRTLLTAGGLLLGLVLARPALGQAPTVVVSPAGPLTLCPGSTRTLTATVDGFNVAGSGFSDYVQAVAVQPDGKVLVGGTFTAYNGNAAAPDYVLRLNADGSLDASFNAGGIGANASVFALAVQPDGKVLVGGTFTAYNGNAAAPDYVLRLNADGSLDAGFNVGGSGANNAAFSLALQPDGKVLVGGAFVAYNGNAAAPDVVLRLNADGSLDTSFNAGGTGAGPTGTTTCIVFQLAVQPDGKVLAGGVFTAYNGNAAAPDGVLRLNADGSLDTGFNAGGAGANAGMLALALQPDGKVLIGGNSTAYNGSFAAPDFVLRLNADGSLDTGFNVGGSGADGYTGYVYALAMQPDGKVLAGGIFTGYNGNAAAPDVVLRLNADGSLDTGFNAGGVGANNTVYDLAVQPDGKVLVGGVLTAYNGNAAAPDYVLRLNADGSLDDGAPAGLAYTWSTGATGPSIVVSAPGDYQATATTSGSGTGYSNVVRVNASPAVTVAVTPAGPLTLPAGGSALLMATASLPGFNVAGSGFDGPVNAVVVQADGKVLVGGGFTSYNGNAAAPDRVLRLNANGSLDTGFNAGGVGANFNVFALAVQPGGKVLVGGDFTTYNGAAAAPDRVLRLNANGSLDTGFNSGGAGTDNTVYALAVQPDGKVLVGGTYLSYNGAAAPDRVLRLNANGSLDTGFNGGGAGADNTVFALAVQPDGKVLAGGFFTNYNGSSAAPNYVLRLNADGSLDTGFNGSGVGADNSVFALAVQPDGKVLAGGNLTGYNGATAAPDFVLRLNADGSLDTGFNSGGAGANSTVRTLAVQPDGKVLAGGNFTGYNGTIAAPDFVLRLNAAGSLDTGFNSGGAGASGGSGTVLALAVQSDGKVLAGGNFTTYNGAATAPDYLLRLNADGSLNGAATALAGATFVFNPGTTRGSNRVVSASGSYQATATDPATGCTYLSNVVVVTVLPTLTVLTPTNGSVGTVISLTGTDLGGAIAVTFSGNNGNVVTSGFIVNAAGTGITGVVVPAGAVTGTLTVTTPAGTSAPSSQSFTVTAASAPVVSGAVNTTVARGGLVTLNGTGLGGATGVTFANATFGNTTLTSFTANTATTLALTLPVAAPANNGVYDVTVTTAVGTSAPFTLTLNNYIDWTGATSTAWATATNWSPPAVPNAYLDVAIAAAANQPTVTGTQECRLLTVNATATLTLAPAASLTTTQHVGLNPGSALTQAAGSELLIGGHLTYNGAALALDPTSELGFGGPLVDHNLYGSTGLTLPILTVGKRLNPSGTDRLHLGVPVRVARKLALANGAEVDNLPGGGSLTLLSTPMATALVVQDANSRVTGTATVQRALATTNAGLGYRHYASPVTGNSLSDLGTATFTPVFDPAYNSRATTHPAAGFPTVFGYDQSRLASAASPYTGFDKGWYSPASPNGIPIFAAGMGYAVNLRGTELVDFVGVPRTGNVAVALPRATGSTGGEGLHLVGNPYPAPIDWSLVTATDRPGLDAVFYVFESSSQNAGSYRSAVNGVGSSTYIGSSQGFFVRVTPGQASGTLTFKNAHRLTDETLNVPVRRSAADARPLVQLLLAGNGASDEVYVYAEAGATAGVDAQYDAVKLTNPSGLNLAAVSATGALLAIDGRPTLATAQRIPLQVAVPANGTYTLTAATLANLPAATAVTLTDVLTGTTTDLRRTASYTFAAAAPAPAVGRFFLNLTPAAGALATATQSLSQSVILFPNPAHGSFALLLPAGTAATAATLVNSLGQTVRTLTATAATTVDVTGLAAGVYTLRLTLVGQPVTKRVMVE